MNRRGFLRLGGLATAGLIFDPELALWRPPKTFVFVQAAPIRRLTLAQIVAVTYDKVIQERRFAMVDQWSDSAFLALLEGR